MPLSQRNSLFDHSDLMRSIKMCADMEEERVKSRWMALSLCILHAHECLMAQTDAFQPPQATTNMY